MNRILPVILLLFLLLMTACGPTHPSAHKILFLVTLDTTRADHIDYNLQNNTLTPNLAKLAAEGFYFENAYSLIPITLPSHANMFFSQPTHQLKIYNNSQPRKIAYPSLAQLLKSKGYQTGAVISLGVLQSQFGLHKGFDKYIENFQPHLWYKEAHEVNRDAFSLIKEMEKQKKGEEKSFYWIHYSDPHEPYYPPGGDGQLQLRLNGNPMFQCPGTDKAVVKVQLQLQPGENTVEMETRLPSYFKSYPDCSFQYIKYTDFSLDPAGEAQPASEGQPAGLVEYRAPAHWTGKKEKDQQHYYSSYTNSTLTVINKSNQPVTAELRFIYTLFVDEETMKVFYKEEIRTVDRAMGELVAFLKENHLYRDSVFLIVGDHGEGLGEYREHYGHIHYLNKVFSHVPLILSGPGVPKIGARAEAVSTLDIAPTLLDIAGTKKPGFMLGQSLLAEEIPPRTILLETYSPEAFFDAFSLIRYPWQIIFNPGFRGKKVQFIDLQNDPYGIINLERAKNINDKVRDPEVQKIKSQLIESILKISRIITATKGKVGKASKRHREILKSLGYL